VVDDQATETGDDGHFFLGSVVKCDGEHPWEVKLKLCGQLEKFKIDTGADVSILTGASYDALENAPYLEPVGAAVLSSVGGPLACRGKFRAKVKKSGKIYHMDMYVVDSAKFNLLSRGAAKAMRFVCLNVNETSCQEPQDMVYGDIGLMKCNPVKISLRRDAEPYSVNAARRISLPLMPKVKAELQRMVTKDVIVPVEEPTEWCARSFLS